VHLVQIWEEKSQE